MRDRIFLGRVFLTPNLKQGIAIVEGEPTLIRSKHYLFSTSVCRYIQHRYMDHGWFSVQKNSKPPKSTIRHFGG